MSSQASSGRPYEWPRVQQITQAWRSSMDPLARLLLPKRGERHVGMTAGSASLDNEAGRMGE